MKVLWRLINIVMAFEEDYRYGTKLLDILIQTRLRQYRSRKSKNVCIQNTLLVDLYGVVFCHDG